MRDDGWLVRVEVEAGKGEVTPLLFVVAAHDHAEAKSIAERAPDVEVEQRKPRVGNQGWPISKVELVSPVDERTISQLRLGRGEVWNVHRPPPTDRIQTTASQITRPHSVREVAGAVRAAIEQHERGDRQAPLSRRVLEQVLAELGEMERSPAFEPKYPRFVLDWPDETGLVKQLIVAAHLHRRAARAQGD